LCRDINGYVNLVNSINHDSRSDYCRFRNCIVAATCPFAYVDLRFEGDDNFVIYVTRWRWFRGEVVWHYDRYCLVSGCDFLEHVSEFCGTKLRFSARHKCFRPADVVVAGVATWQETSDKVSVSYCFVTGSGFGYLCRSAAAVFMLMRFGLYI